MPIVNGINYPYTPKGMLAAQKAGKKSGKKIKKKY